MKKLTNSELNEMMDCEIQRMINELTALLDQSGNNKPNEKLFNTVKASMISRYTDELEFFAFKGFDTEVSHSLDMIEQILAMKI